MRRNAKPITAPPEIVNHIDGLTEANFKLLTSLVPWLAANDKLQQKFRVAVLDKLARIEMVTSLLLVDQIARTQGKPPWFQADKLEKDAKETDEFITQKSEQTLLNALRYIYGKEPAPELRHDRRRRWSDWEI